MLATCGFFRTQARESWAGYGALWPGLALAGIGSGFLTGPATAVAVNHVPQTQAGMASASVNMFRQLGSALGPSILGTIITTRYQHNLTHEPGARAFTDAVHLGYLVAGLALLAVAVPAAVLVGRLAKAPSSLHQAPLSGAALR